MGKKFLAMLLALLLLFSISKSAALGNNNNYKNVSDQHSLLAFKNAVSFDPDNSLGNWSPNVSFCKWIGVTCSTHMRRVVGLNLSGMDLEGAISPLVGNLSALQTLDLSDNRLRGSIPVELTQLSHLQVLRLGANYITEYGLGGRVSIKGDVYSYGILLLELVSRKRPTNDMFVGDLNMRNWVRSAFPNRLMDIVDSRLWRSVNMEQNMCLISFIHVGLLCTNESPQERPTMRDVGRALESLKTSATSNSTLTTTISDLIRNTNTSAKAGVSDSQSSTF